jgi:hypothetical protein
MHISSIPWARMAIIAVCAVTVSTGCFLDRRPRPSPDWSQLEPREYCPGDQISTGFDFLSPLTCPASLTAEQCNANGPIITIASLDSPESFPARTFPLSLRGGFTFTAPDVPSITARFSDSRGIDVTVPQFNSDGMLGGMQRGVPQTHQRAIHRVDETEYRPVQHEEICMAGSPVAYTSAEIRSVGMSPNAKLTEVCNAEEAVSFKISLTGSATGDTYEKNLAPGECARLNDPGILDGVRLSTTLSIKPIAVPENACMDIKDRRTYIATKVKFGCS